MIARPLVSSREVAERGMERVCAYAGACTARGGVLERRQELSRARFLSGFIYARQKVARMEDMGDLSSVSTKEAGR